MSEVCLLREDFKSFLIERFDLEQIITNDLNADDDSGWAAGGTIALGPFTKYDKFYSALFHEIGHTRKVNQQRKRWERVDIEGGVNNEWTQFRYDNEYLCWKWARRVLRLFGKEINSDYANDNLSTYARDDNIEWPLPKGFKPKSI